MSRTILFAAFALLLAGCSTPTGTVAPKPVAAQQVNFSESGQQDAGIVGLGPMPAPASNTTTTGGTP
jgi:starvation-inducible outer membrane lipoprotein